MPSERAALVNAAHGLKPPRPLHRIKSDAAGDAGDAGDDADAANEHVVVSLPFRISFDEIEKQFGVGTRVYWHFLTFVIVSNAILAVVS